MYSSIFPGGLKNGIQTFLGAILIFALTFPEIDGEINTGLDASYFWALSYLVEMNYGFLQELIYPYGPLGFLKSIICTGQSFLISLIFYTVVKIWFLFKFLDYKIEATRTGLKIILSFILGIFLSIDYYLIGLILLYGLQFLDQSRYLHLILMSTLAMIGLCIKSSIGINCYSTLIVVLIIHAKKAHNSKEKLLPILTMCLVSLGVSLLIFGNISLAFRYIINIFRFATGYSSALSLPAAHNWAYLLIVSIAMLIPLLYRGKQQVWQTFWLLAPIGLASWKHSMARADNSHLTIFFTFILIYWAVIIVATKIPIKTALSAMAISVCLYYANMQNAWNFEEKTIGLSGITNFSHILLNYSGEINNCEEESIANLKPAILDDSTKHLIGKQSIDSYPWELSFFAANPELNWKPRRTLQSGSYARWLDSYNAEDFDETNGPEFLIFHFVSNDQSDGLGSVDERYLLSDNPLTIFSIFNFYSPVKKTGQFLLLKKNRSANNLNPSVTSEKFNLKWNDWVNVDRRVEGIARLHLFMKVSIGDRIRNIFNTTPNFFIDYQLTNGRILTFRFIPENAEDGIWLNPLISNIFSPCTLTEVQKFRIRTENNISNEIQLSYHLEQTNFRANSSIQSVQEYFYLTPEYPDTILNLERFIHAADSNEKDILSIQEGLFSYTYKIDLDTFWQSVPDTIHEVELESYFNYLNKSSSGSHVIALANTEHKLYKPLALKQSEKMLGAYQSTALNRKNHSSGILTCYLWNNGTDTIHQSKSWLRIYTKCD